MSPSETLTDDSKCPVPHDKRETWLNSMKNSDNSNTSSGLTPAPATTQNEEKCPVPHESRDIWLKSQGVAKNSTSVPTQDIECDSSTLPETPHYKTDVKLPEEREVSSIPRTNSHGNWVYPSQKQFYEAMIRKNWNPDAKDMETIIPIHNSINERCWNYIKLWEKNQGGDECGGIQLTSFKGDSKKMTPRAFIRSYILGYTKPFDRHDWTVNRCGKNIDYVIDFYSEEDSKGRPQVYLDVRPKLNSFEGIKLRVMRSLGLQK